MMKIMRKYHQWNFNRKQEEVDDDCEKYGLTEELLEKEVEFDICVK